MSTTLSPRDQMVADWYLEDYVDHQGKLPTPEGVYVYMKALMDVASADGKLSAKEHDWILGFAAVCGTPDDKLDQLKAYKPGKCDDVNLLFQDLELSYAKMSRLSLVYNGFRAAGSDGELHSREIEAIYALGKKCGLNDEQVKEMHSLYEENEKFRQKRTQAMFPEGFDGFLTLLNERHT